MTEVQDRPSTHPAALPSAPPRILYLTEFWPHHTTNGAELRSLNVLRALEQIGNVEVLVLDDTENAADLVSQSSRIINRVNAARLVPRTNQAWKQKLEWMFNARASYPHGCGVDDAGTRHVLSRINDYDLIWFFKLRTPNMFPYAPWPRSVVDVDDVPSTYERTTSQREHRLGKRCHAQVRAWCWQRREKLLGERFQSLTVCSEGDRRYLKKMGVNAPVHVVPNGFDKPDTAPVRQLASPPRVGFIGLFDYFANREGIHWFARECWPRIKQKVPNARLRLVGQGSDGPFKPSAADVDALGWLPNPSDEVKTWSVMVVPIRVGAGTRVKIAYGFGQKCPVVSTSLGSYGYECEHGRDLYLADSAQDFADACIKTILNPADGAALAERAWNQFLKKWTWDAIRPRIWAAAQACLRHDSTAIGKLLRTG